jgi:hypothetical protein
MDFEELALKSVDPSLGPSVTDLDPACSSGQTLNKEATSGNNKVKKQIIVSLSNNPRELTYDLVITCPYLLYFDTNRSVLNVCLFLLDSTCLSAICPPCCNTIYNPSSLSDPLASRSRRPHTPPSKGVLHMDDYCSIDNAIHDRP